MSEHAIDFAPRLTGRSSALAIAYEHLGWILIVLDPLLLLSTALLGHEVHCRIRHGVPGDTMRFAAVAAIPMAVLLPLLSLNGAYHPDRIVDPRGSARRIVGPCIAAGLFLWIIVSGLGIEGRVDTVGLAVFALGAPAVLLVSRYRVASALCSSIAGGQLRFRRAYTIAEAPAGDGGEQSDSVAVPDLSMLDRTTLDRLIAGIRASGAEEIHLVCRQRSLAECRALLAELRRVPIPVKLIADAGQAELLRCRLVPAHDTFAFELQRAPLNLIERAAKRCVDLVLALVLCFALAPLLVVVGMLVRLTSRGPALFRQTRNGFNGRPFEIYKFRTMTVQEDGTRVVQARRNDARITPIGRLLRRTSIDELPQLLNVLKGEMSLIGPRPHAMAHDHDFSARVADYALRHHVKPGITGLAQVEGFRGETSTPEAIERRVEFDLRYIERWSFWLDLWIMLRTVRALVTPQNAY